MRILLIVLSLAGCVLADEASPKSPAAVAAEKRFDSAASKARATYLTAMIAAEKQLLVDLDKAQAVAMHGNNLDEAEKIKAARADAQSKLEAHQNEIKNPKGGEDSGSSEAAPAAGDVLAFAGMLAKLPKELKPAGREWDQQSMAKANEWVKSNIQGQNLQLAVLNSGGVTMTADGDLTGGSFSIAEAQGFQVVGTFRDKAAMARSLKIQRGQRFKIRGLLTELRFDSAKSGYLRIDPAEFVE